MVPYCYNGYSWYADNINESKYVITKQSYFKGLSIHEDKIHQPRFVHQYYFLHGWCSVHFFLGGVEYLFTRYQFCQDNFFGFGSSKTNIIPSLASCVEIYFFSSSWFCKHRGRRKFVCCVQIIRKAVSESRPCTNRMNVVNTLFKCAFVATSKY